MADRRNFGNINYLFMASDGNLERIIEQSEYDTRKANNDPFVRLTGKDRPVEFFNDGLSLGMIVGFEVGESKTGFKIAKLVVDYGEGKDVLTIIRKGTYGLTSVFKNLVNQIAGIDLKRPVKIKPYVRKTTHNGKDYKSEYFYTTYEDGEVVPSKYTYKKEETIIPPIEKVEKLGEISYDSSKQDDFFWQEYLKIKATLDSINASGFRAPSDFSQHSDLDKSSEESFESSVPKTLLDNAPASDEFDDLPF